MNSKSRKKRVDFEKRRKAYLYSLPGFLSQLLLLMESGMVLQDGFCRIAEGYAQLPDKRKNPFIEEVCRIHQVSRNNGGNTVRMFYSFGKSCGVKEVARAAGIMAENQDKGSDLRDKLEEESSRLWQVRKQAALEEIRISESKMSFPLGILMISLLLLTAAPAMMQL